MDPTITMTLSWSARLAALGSCLIFAEFWVSRGVLRDTGLMSWEVSRLRTDITRCWSRILHPILSFPNVLVVLVVGLVCAVAILALNLEGTEAAAPCLVLLSIHALLFARSPQGQDGADQMTMQVYAAVAAGWIAPSELGARLALGFLAAQLCLSYFVAGMAKVTSSTWRGGSALSHVFQTRMYGNVRVARWLNQYPTIARLFAMAGVGFELAFPAVLFLPQPFAIGLLGSGILFHLSTAVFMGLNTFFWAFVSAYPALYFWVR